MPKDVQVEADVLQIGRLNIRAFGFRFGFIFCFARRLFDVVSIKTKSLGVNDWRKFSRANDVFNHYTSTIVTLPDLWIRPSLVVQLN